MPRKRPEVKKVAAMLTTEELTKAEQQDMIVWLEDIVRKLQAGKISRKEFSASLNYY